MAKKHKLFGEWVSTTLIPHVGSVKRYKQGFVVKEWGGKTEELKVMYANDEEMMKMGIELLNKLRTRIKKKKENTK